MSHPRCVGYTKVNNCAMAIRAETFSWGIYISDNIVVFKTVYLRTIVYLLLNNNRLYFNHKRVLLYGWAKLMWKPLKSRSTYISSIFYPHSTASDIHSFSMRQRKRRTSETTLKHKTIFQLDICYTLFPNTEHSHTLIHFSHSNKRFISH